MNKKVLAIIASIVVVAAVVAGFVTVGSPAKQRQIKFDQQRTSDLQSIQYQIIYYWQQKGSLPGNLSSLSDSISGFSAPKDPETGSAYTYTIKSGLNFELCANFDLPSSASIDSRTYPAPYPASLGSVDTSNNVWDHPEGNHCFDRTIDPQLYKTLTPPIK